MAIVARVRITFEDPTEYDKFPLERVILSLSIGDQVG